jgi:HAD superfamily hydrolase (TIGR01484 family)
MIRAAVVDLDGTLIGRNQNISARVALAVSQLCVKLPLCIATGREPADTIRFARQLGLTAPQICDGGATILDPASGQSLWTSPLKPGIAQEIINTLHDVGAAFIATHPGGSITSVSQLPHWNLTRVSALDLEEKEADALVDRFSSNPDLHAVKVVLPYNNLWAVDFTHSGVNKAAATLELSQMIGVDAGSMVAAGDSYNDMPLLQVCGLGIAMGNAPDELKAIADYVAPPVEEDGLAVAIEQFIMPRL